MKINTFKKNIENKKNKTFPKKNITLDYATIRIASPQEIKNKSYGHIKKPDTINYRTFKPERGGLFCAKIFGPIRDYECLCGKYKRLKHRGVICEKCGVEVISTQVRRKRFGHIELISPVTHPWFLKGTPNQIKIALGEDDTEQVEKILAFENYIIIEPENLEGTIISETMYKEWKKKIPNLCAKTGTNGLKTFFEQIEQNLDNFIKKKENNLNFVKEKKKSAILKQIKLLTFFKNANINLSWLFITILPVLPPELRPLVQLENGKFASSDLNDLYRRIINRNNRLKKLIELDAPAIILQNEKRMLEDAVTALLDNSKIGHKTINGTQRQLKSLSEILKGKEGRLRQNLLGKRVDYSGRTVIVSGPKLQLNQCGLPKQIALELFKPFIYHKILLRGFATTIKDAKILVESNNPIASYLLKEIVKDYPILLNRAPTLHRLGIQSFEPIIIDSKAIELHPLVCQAFNADFDGDQMAIHIPLSIEAQLEARILLLSTENILSPASGLVTIAPTKDMLLGLYYLSWKKKIHLKKTTTLLTIQKISQYINTTKYRTKDNLHKSIFFKENGKIIETTIGRLILYEQLRKKKLFPFFNRLLDKQTTQHTLLVCFKFFGKNKTIKLANCFMNLGFFYSTISGTSLCLSNLKTPYTKKPCIEKIKEYEKKFSSQYKKKNISTENYLKQILYLWTIVNNKITKDVKQRFAKKKPQWNPLNLMFLSGARGSTTQILQLTGMRGLISKPDGTIFPVPILSNFKEGLSVFEYFISTHGARKGLADTALKTANSGYLTRKLVDIAQNIIIVEEDCKTTDGLIVSAKSYNNKLISLKEQLNGRTIIKKEKKNAEIRSPLFCKTIRGICAQCYGKDLSTNKLIDIGTSVGIIAAQSIGEPGTQLTMRTFHTGGVAPGEFKINNLQVKNNGFIFFENIILANHTVISENGFITINNKNNKELERYSIPYGSIVKKKHKKFIKKNSILAQWDHNFKPIVAEISGIVTYKNIFENSTYKKTICSKTGLIKATLNNIQNIKKAIITIQNNKKKKDHYLKKNAILLVKNKTYVKKGEFLAKYKRETIDAKDITQGLIKITDIFEARDNKSTIKLFAEDSGILLFYKKKNSKKKNKNKSAQIIYIIDPITNKVLSKYSIEKNEIILAKNGLYVKKGDNLSNGISINQKNLLRSLGTQALADYIIDEIQNVYTAEGVKINNKHIEIIIKQMLQYVSVTNNIPKKFMEKDLMLKNIVNCINTMKNQNKSIDYKQTVLGITKVALNAQSFLAAASFQETSKVLTKAIIEGKKDYFLGLKENVMAGNLIPCGTGFSAENYKKKIQLEQKNLIDNILNI